MVRQAHHERMKKDSAIVPYQARGRLFFRRSNGCIVYGAIALYSGRESFVLSQLASEWDNVKGWKPELRYESNPSATRAQAERRITEIERIRRAL